jgi:hypothetical protein
MAIISRGNESRALPKDAHFRIGMRSDGTWSGSLAADCADGA